MLKTFQGYVYRESVSEAGANTPDHRLPQRILHQKEPKSGYVLKKGGDHSILEVPERQPGVRSETAKKDTGYVLKKSLPPTGVAAHIDSRRVGRRNKRRRNLSPSQAIPSFSMDRTTRDIIGALESNADTSQYDSDHLDIAKGIRDALRAADSNFSLDKMGSAINSSGDGAKDLKDAEKYLAELSRLRDDVEMDAADMEEYMEDYDDEEYYDEDYEDWPPDDNSLSVPVPGRPQATPTSPSTHNYRDYTQTSDPTNDKIRNGASQQQPTNNIGPRLPQDYIEPPLSHDAPGNPDNIDMSGTPDDKRGNRDRQPDGAQDYNPNHLD